MSIANLASAAIRYALEHAKIKKTTKTIEVRTIVFEQENFKAKVRRSGRKYMVV